MTALTSHEELSVLWWNATRERRLVLQGCERCGRRQHYPRTLCIHCSGSHLRFMDATGRGRVDTWTEVARSPSPDIAAPYFVARVRLEEGPILLSRLVDVASGQQLIDLPVALEWRPLPDGRNLPVFGPMRDG